jgi:3-oxoacyl-[acyl-carrier-protein] synthase-3
MVVRVMQQASWTMDQLDAFIPHQANLFMLQHLAKRMKVPKEKVVLALEEFGNTSSASVPLAMTHALKDRLRSKSSNLIMAGFGVGWSWGAVAATWGPMTMSDLVLLKDK